MRIYAKDNKYYKVLGIALNIEEGEDVVVFQALYGQFNLYTLYKSKFFEQYEPVDNLDLEHRFEIYLGSKNQNLNDLFLRCGIQKISELHKTITLRRIVLEYPDLNLDWLLGISDNMYK